jgi:hypothetical protein
MVTNPKTQNNYLRKQDGGGGVGGGGCGVSKHYNLPFVRPLGKKIEIKKLK